VAVAVADGVGAFPWMRGGGRFTASGVRRGSRPAAAPAMPLHPSPYSRPQFDALPRVPRTCNGAPAFSWSPRLDSSASSVDSRRGRRSRCGDVASTSPPSLRPRMSVGSPTGSARAPFGPAERPTLRTASRGHRQKRRDASVHRHAHPHALSAASVRGHYKQITPLGSAPAAPRIDGDPHGRTNARCNFTRPHTSGEVGERGGGHGTHQQQQHPALSGCRDEAPPCGFWACGAGRPASPRKSCPNVPRDTEK
jgi:hypothetical protein